MTWQLTQGLTQLEAVPFASSPNGHRECEVLPRIVQDPCTRRPSWRATKARSQINDNIHSMVMKIYERRNEAQECFASRMRLAE